MSHLYDVNIMREYLPLYHRRSPSCLQRLQACALLVGLFHPAFHPAFCLSVRFTPTTTRTTMICLKVNWFLKLLVDR